MKRALMLMSVACAAGFILGACSHYYKVRDPASGTVYYTDHVSHHGAGAIVFKDTVTKQEVTLSASEVMPITKDQFQANIHGR